MAHEETICGLMESLVIADKHIIGDIMAHKEIWTAGTSTVNNSYKALNLLVDSGKLIRGTSFYKLPNCKSEYKEHSRLLTKAVAEILKLNYQTKIFREHSIEEKGLRPDAIVLLTRNGKGLCFFLEVCNNETPDYLQSKINTIKHWPEATDYLSNLFKTKINEFEIIVSGDLTSDDAIGFDTFLEEVSK